MTFICSWNHTAIIKSWENPNLIVVWVFFCLMRQVYDYIEFKWKMKRRNSIDWFLWHTYAFLFWQEACEIDRLKMNRKIYFFMESIWLLFQSALHQFFATSLWYWVDGNLWMTFYEGLSILVLMQHTWKFNFFNWNFKI